jgi:hypothetical protein
VLGVEGLRQAAPADILSQHLLLGHGGGAAGAFQFLDQTDRLDVLAVLGLLAASAQREFLLYREIARGRVELRRV